MRRVLVLLPLAAALVLLSASAAATTAVSITSTGFRPSSLTIAAGDSLVWTNNDAATHQVVANDGSFSSPGLASKQSFSHIFRSGGTFPYHDGLHPALKGSVTVVPPRTVWVTGSGFVPSSISILTGQSVTWVNKTKANHQVVADDASFVSLVLAPGATFSHTFASTGTFHYRDGLQPTLKGTVVVTAPPPGESITLDSDVSAVTYGKSLDLNGSVTNGTAGEKVTIVATPQTAAGKGLRSAQTVTTRSDGTFTATEQPLIETVYTAQTAKSHSDPLVLNVRPRLQLVTSRSRAVVRAFAVRGFVHRFALVQRLRRGVWVTTARFRFTRATPLASPTVMTSAVVRLRLRHGLRLRVLMPFSQTRPGYISARSNVALS